MSVELPLFPLNTVLFPHMPLGLHIFEERYRAMMRDCREAGTTFGVVAIREGVEAGGAATPYSVGTLAQLRNVEELDDGRYNLLVVGASRFRVSRLIHEQQYLTGTVSYLEDDPVAPDDTALLAQRLRGAFEQYVAEAARITGAQASDVSLPDDPELLAYLVAASLPVEVARKQELLEVNSTAARLDGCLELLRRESVLMAGLATRAATPNRLPRVSLN